MIYEKLYVYVWLVLYNPTYVGLYSYYSLLVSAQADDLWLAFRVRSFVRSCVRNAKIFQRTYYLILI